MSDSDDEAKARAIFAQIEQGLSALEARTDRLMALYGLTQPKLDQAFAQIEQGLSALEARTDRLMARYGLTQPKLDQAIAMTLTDIARRGDEELFALTESQLLADWHFTWDARGDHAWNLYQFSDQLEMYKRRCRRWETHHNGSPLVVERVRDKYLMPRINEFLRNQWPSLGR